MWAGTCAPSTMVKMPAALALRQISSAGNTRAVSLVMWLRKITLVRGVTWAQNRSTKSAWVLTGTGMGTCTYRAPACAQMTRQVRFIASYSWSVVSTSSPGCRCRLRATMFTAVVGLGTYTRSSAWVPR